jgi:hypothetical protein
MTRTRENDFPVQFGVVDVRLAKGSGSVYVAVIGNINVRTSFTPSSTKKWTSIETTPNSLMLLFSLQWKFPRREVVRILQREKKTLLTVIRFGEGVFEPGIPTSHSEFPLHRSETSENVPFRVENHCQSVCVTVTEVAKVFCFEPSPTIPAQNFEMLSP